MKNCESAKQSELGRGTVVGHEKGWCLGSVKCNKRRIYWKVLAPSGKGNQGKKWIEGGKDEKVGFLDLITVCWCGVFSIW